jgi:hypothetical protein
MLRGEMRAMAKKRAPRTGGKGSSGVALFVKKEPVSV